MTALIRARSRAQLFHGVQGCFQHAAAALAQRAFPAGMGGADHLGLGVGQKHWRAVGGEDAQRQARRGGNHGVAFEPGRAFAAQGRGKVCTIGLWIWDRLTSCVPGASADSDTAAVFADGFRSIFGARAAIEGTVDSGRNAAVAVEEAVRDAGRLEAFGLPLSSSVMARKPAMPPIDGGAKARALNSLPIWSLPISLSVAASSFCGFVRIGLHQLFGAFDDADIGQEHALRHRPEYRCAAAAAGLGQRGEIHMGGNIVLARLGQGIGEPVAAHRLQGFRKSGRPRHSHSRSSMPRRRCAAMMRAMSSASAVAAGEAS